MGFGRNKHDSWLQFCEMHRAVLSATTLPRSVTDAEHRFRDLLREGTVRVAAQEFALGSLGDTEWVALSQFAANFFHEFESYAPLELFPAFAVEAKRRDRDNAASV